MTKCKHCGHYIIEHRNKKTGWVHVSGNLHWHQCAFYAEPEEESK